MLDAVYKCIQLMMKIMVLIWKFFTGVQMKFHSADHDETMPN